MDLLLLNIGKKIGINFINTMPDILNNIKKDFLRQNILNKLIYINIGLFLCFSILNVFSFMFQFELNSTLNKLYLPADNTVLVKQPWSLLTYMFLHKGIIHLALNMIWLYFAGKIFIEYLKPEQLLSIYLLGGISGGLLFIIAYNYIPVLEPLLSNVKAIGASASVLAVMVAIATYLPNYNVNLPLIGNIPLKLIAIVCVILDILSIPSENTGGHIAHLGGAIFGYIYIKQLKKKNTSSNFIKFLIKKLNSIFKRKTKVKSIYKRKNSDYEFNKKRAEHQKKIDNILEKIAKSGYDSLNKVEKDLLFTESKK